MQPQSTTSNPPSPHLCAYCHKPLLVRQRKFCSHPCYAKSRRGVARPEHGAKVSAVLKGRPLSMANRIHLSESRKASGIAKGERNPAWKGGRILDKDGYVLIRMPEHPCAVDGYVREHRLVMEAQLGRTLEKSELVHHVNEEHPDNRPENLRVALGNKGHAVFHAGQKRRSRCQTTAK